jgi:hypothetical protein
LIPLNPRPPLRPPSVSLESATDYLQHHRRTEIIASSVGAVLALCGAALTFLVIFWAAYISFFPMGRPSQTWLWVALGVTAFSFVAHACTDPEYLSKLEVRTVDGRPAYNIPLPGGWRLSNVDYRHPKNLQSLAKIILQLLTTGPRGLFGSWRYLKRAIALSQIEISTVAPLFRRLVEYGRRISYDELAGEAIRDPEKAFSALLLLGDEQHLPSEPQGLVVTSRCRERITGINSSTTDF